MIMMVIGILNPGDRVYSQTYFKRTKVKHGVYIEIHRRVDLVLQNAPKSNYLYQYIAFIVCT